MNPLPQKWTPEEDVILKRMVGEGLSFTTIAHALGRSRNSTIGRSHRMGMYSESKLIGGRPKTNRPPVQHIATACAPRFNPQVQKRIAVPKLVRPEPAPPALPVDATAKGWPKPLTATAVGFMGLTADTCRMPLWCDNTTFADQRYCGAKTAPESSWCPACKLAVRDQNYAIRRRSA